MKIAIFGPPGSGKGTQAYLLQQTCGMAHLSTGDLLRRVATETGPLADQVRAIAPGTFATDELIIELLKIELANPAYQSGVILDGFPRTVAQVDKMFQLGLQVDLAIEIELDDPAIIRTRLVNRCSHSSGRIYNSETNPPRVSGRDDVTGDPLTYREDDCAGFVPRRLADWHAKTFPAVRALQASGRTLWLKVDGRDDIESIHNDLVLGIAFATALDFNPKEGVIRISQGNLMASQEIPDDPENPENNQSLKGGSTPSAASSSSPVPPARQRLGV